MWVIVCGWIAITSLLIIFIRPVDIMKIILIGKVQGPELTVFDSLSVG